MILPCSGNDEFGVELSSDAPGDSIDLIFGIDEESSNEVGKLFE